MKRGLAFAAVILLLLIPACSASAHNDADVRASFALTLTDGYTVLERDTLSRHEDFLKRLGYTVSTFRNAMTDGNVYLYAATDDNDRQVQVRSWGAEDGIAHKLTDFSYLGEKERTVALRELGETAASDGELLESEIIERDGQTFFRYRVRADGELESDSGTIGYAFDEYLTVANGRFYALLYYNAATDFSAAEEAESRALFAAFSVTPTENGHNGLPVLLRVFTAALMIAAAIVIVYLLTTFFRDFRARRDQPESIHNHRKTWRK